MMNKYAQKLALIADSGAYLQFFGVVNSDLSGFPEKGSSESIVKI